MDQISKTPQIAEEKSEKKSKAITITFNPQTFFTTLLIVLVLVSGIQTAQLFSLKRAVGDGALFKSAQAAPTVDALPDMVGGC